MQFRLAVLFYSRSPRRTIPWCPHNLTFLNTALSHILFTSKWLFASHPRKLYALQNFLRWLSLFQHCSEYCYHYASWYRHDLSWNFPPLKVIFPRRGAIRTSIHVSIFRRYWSIALLQLMQYIDFEFSVCFIREKSSNQLLWIEWPLSDFGMGLGSPLIDCLSRIGSSIDSICLTWELEGSSKLGAIIGFLERNCMIPVCHWLTKSD